MRGNICAVSLTSRLHEFVGDRADLPTAEPGSQQPGGYRLADLSVNSRDEQNHDFEGRSPVDRHVSLRLGVPPRDEQDRVVGEQDVARGTEPRFVACTEFLQRAPRPAAARGGIGAGQFQVAQDLPGRRERQRRACFILVQHVRAD